MTDNDRILERLGELGGKVDGLLLRFSETCDRLDRNEGKQWEAITKHGEALATKCAHIDDLERRVGGLEVEDKDLDKRIRSIANRSGLKAGAAAGIPGALAFLKEIVEAIKGSIMGGG